MVSPFHSRNIGIAFRLGDPDFQAEIIPVLPIGFAGVGYAVAIAVFKVIGQAVGVVIIGVAVAIERHVVEANVQSGIGLLCLACLCGVMIKARQRRIGYAAGVDQVGQAGGGTRRRIVKLAQRPHLIIHNQIGLVA